MSFKKCAKLLLIFIFIALYLNSISTILLAKPLDKPKTNQKLTIQLDAKRSYPVISFLENKYVVLREETAVVNNFRFTVIDKSNYKMLRRYNLNFGGKIGMTWRKANWDSELNNRYFIANQSNSNGTGSTNFLVDILTGSRIQLKETGGIVFFPSPSGKGILIGVPGGKYSILNIKSGKRIEDLTPTSEWNGQQQNHFWNKYDSIVYYKDGWLQLLNIDSMQAITLGQRGTQTYFLDWTPDGKGLFYVDNHELKLYQLGGFTTVLGNFLTSKEHQNWVSSYGLDHFVQWNSDKSKVAIQDFESIYLYDMKTSVYHNVYRPNLKPEYEYSKFNVYWSPDRSDIVLFGEPEVQMDADINLNVFINGSQSVKIKLNYKEVTFYKNYLLFLTGLERVGNGSTLAHKLGVYDLKAKKLQLIDNIGNYEISADKKKVFIYPDNMLTSAQAYLLDENAWQVGKEVQGLRWPFQFDRLLLEKDSKGKRLLYSKEKGYVSVFDFKTMKRQELLSLAQKEPWDVIQGKNIMLVTIFNSKKVYFYNWRRFWSVSYQEKSKPMFGLAPDENDYFYLVNSKGKVYFKLFKIPIN